MIVVCKSCQSRERREPASGGKWYYQDMSRAPKEKIWVGDKAELARLNDRAIEQAIDRSTDRGIKQVIEWASERAIERSSDQNIERPSDPTIERVIERSSDRSFSTLLGIEFSDPNW